MKVFGTAGCSFTYGQGLYYYRWINEWKKYTFEDYENEGWQWEDANPKKAIRHKLTQQDLEYMKSISYGGLLSKTLGWEYMSTNQNDGNSNLNTFDSIENWVYSCEDHPYRDIKFIVVQTTEPFRSFNSDFDINDIFDKYGKYPMFHKDVKLRENPTERTAGETDEKMLQHYHGHIGEESQKFIDLEKKFREQYGVQLILFNWQPEMRVYLQDKPWFITFENGKTCLDDLNQWTIACELGEHFGIYDHHPSKTTHQLIHDKVIEKLEEFKII